jgi:hypothetical protein
MKAFIIAVAAVLSLTACTNYGKKVTNGHVEVYYKDGITKEEAEKAAKLLYEADKAANNDISKTKSIQFTKTGDTVNLRMVTDKEKLKDIKDNVFVIMGNVIADSIFNGKPVNIDLTDNKFVTIRTVHFQKFDYAGDEGEGLGTKYTSGFVEVYAKGDIGSTMANELAGVLEKYFQPQETYSFQVSKNENNEFVVKMVTNPDKVDKVTTELLTEISTKISSEVLNGSPLLFELTDSKLNALKTFAYPSDAAAKPDSAAGKQ